MKLFIVGAICFFVGMYFGYEGAKEVAKNKAYRLIEKLDRAKVKEASEPARLHNETLNAVISALEINFIFGGWL